MSFDRGGETSSEVFKMRLQLCTGGLRDEFDGIAQGGGVLRDCAKLALVNVPLAQNCDRFECPFG